MKYYIILYLLSIIFLPKYESNFYYTFIKYHYFYRWLLLKGYSPLCFKLIYFILFIIFILFYPILSYIFPNFCWGKIMGLDLAFPAQLALMKNYNLAKATYSKLFWYNTFKKYNINTPNVVSYIKNNKINVLNQINKDKYYIMKPEYGSNGNMVQKVKFNQFNKNNFILQEYIKDLNNKTRTIRIVTLHYQNKTSIFLIIQYTSDHLSSNTINLTFDNGIALSLKQKLCENNICNFLSNKENEMIKNISKQLLQLHRNKFNFISFIGWDVILNDKGPFVLEGNITPDISFRKNDYILIIKNLYKKLSEYI